MFSLWNQISLYMFLPGKRFHKVLLVCQPASLPGNLEFRKTSNVSKLIFLYEIPNISGRHVHKHFDLIELFVIIIVYFELSCWIVFLQ